MVAGRKAGYPGSQGRVAELVDAQASEACGSNPVEVQVLSRPPRRLKMKYFVYILECADKSLYTGITLDLKRRLTEHLDGSSKYTRSKLPVKLVYSEVAEDRVEAAKKEREIKSWSRAGKLELIRSSR